MESYNKIELKSSSILMFILCAFFILISSIVLFILSEKIISCLFFILALFFIRYVITHKSINKIIIDNENIIIEYSNCLKKTKLSLDKKDIKAFNILFETYEAKGIWTNTYLSISMANDKQYQINDEKRNFDLFEFLCKNRVNIPNCEIKTKTDIKYGLGSKESLDYYIQNLNFSETIQREQKDIKLAIKILICLFLIILVPMIINILISFIQWNIK